MAAPPATSSFTPANRLIQGLIHGLITAPMASKLPAVAAPNTLTDTCRHLHQLRKDPSVAALALLGHKELHPLVHCSGCFHGMWTGDVPCRRSAAEAHCQRRGRRLVPGTTPACRSKHCMCS